MNSTDDSTSYNAERHAQAVAAAIRGESVVVNAGHADKLEYGWWERKRGHVLLPRTLGQKNNYVLTHEELCAYDLELVQMHEWIDQERQRVRNTLVVLRKGVIGRIIGVTEPTCFTIAHILEGMVKLAKFKLGIMKVLHYIAKERALEKRLAGEAD